MKRNFCNYFGIFDRSTDDRRYPLNILIGLTCVLGSTITVAHNPRVELNDWSDLDNPYVIEDPTVSFAMYGYLDGKDVDTFRFTFNSEPHRFSIRISVPVCDGRYNNFHADYGFFELKKYSTADTGAENFPFELPENLNLLAKSKRPTERKIRTSRVSKRQYYKTPTYKQEVSVGQEFVLYIYNTSEVAGDYLLTFGKKEVFFPLLDSEPEAALVGEDRTGIWPHVECSDG
jgi:hypothetical protein